MIRDDIIIAFAKLRAAGRDARAELLAAAAGLPPRQCAAIAREVEAVAALFETTCPARKMLSDRPPAEERTTRLTKRERIAQRRYFKDFAERLSAQLRAR
jgi:phage FluMu protein Com